MTTIEEAVNALLLATPSITAIVGAADAARIYPQVVPQDAARPALSYKKPGSQKNHSQSGSSHLARSRFEIICQAETYTGAKALVNAVRDALIGYRGTVSGVRIDGILIDDEGDNDMEVLSNEVWPYANLALAIWHNE